MKLKCFPTPIGGIDHRLLEKVKNMVWTPCSPHKLFETEEFTRQIFTLIPHMPVRQYCHLMRYAFEEFTLFEGEVLAVLIEYVGNFSKEISIHEYLEENYTKGKIRSQRRKPLSQVETNCIKQYILDLSETIDDSHFSLLNESTLRGIDAFSKDQEYQENSRAIAFVLTSDEDQYLGHIYGYISSKTMHPNKGEKTTLTVQGIRTSWRNFVYGIYKSPLAQKNIAKWLFAGIAKYVLNQLYPRVDVITVDSPIGPMPAILESIGFKFGLLGIIGVSSTINSIKQYLAPFINETQVVSICCHGDLASFEKEEKMEEKEPNKSSNTFNEQLLKWIYIFMFETDGRGSFKSFFITSDAGDKIKVTFRGQRWSRSVEFKVVTIAIQLSGSDTVDAKSFDVNHEKIQMKQFIEEYISRMQPYKSFQIKVPSYSDVFSPNKQISLFSQNLEFKSLEWMEDDDTFVAIIKK